MTKVIGVDSGKYATKAYTVEDGVKSRKILFRTKMDATEEDKASDKRSCVTEYQGEKFLMGEAAESIDYEKNKAKKIHKISIYTAVAELVEDKDEVILAVGCPLAIFNNKEARESYKKYIEGERDIQISINGLKRSFSIKKVIACPESSGIIYKNVSKFKNALVGVIDIGGLNTNCCVYNKLIPIANTSFTTNLGANILRNNLKQELNSAFPQANLQDFQMENILEKGYIKAEKEESRKFIQNYLQHHIKDVIGETERKGWDTRNLDIIFVGGGSLMLEKEILNIIPDAKISENADWDNVEGFYAIGKINS